jgi:hypothetical protein
MEEVAIGDFTRPIIPRKESTTHEKLEKAEATIANEAAKAEENLKPMASFEERLKKVGVTRAEAATIVDNVLMKGFHSDPFTLTSRMMGRFRTREYRDTMRLHTVLEVQRPSFNTHYQELVFKHSLAASLEQLGSRKFEFPSSSASDDVVEKAFDERLKFVESLPDLTTRLLYDKLSKFDEKMRTCLEEGTIENF